MTALDEAIRWKRGYIDELIAVIDKSSIPAADKTSRTQFLEHERKVLKGPDKLSAWHVVGANLFHAIETTQRLYDKSTKEDEQSSWRRLLDERLRLFAALQGEGPPIPGR